MLHLMSKQRKEKRRKRRDNWEERGKEGKGRKEKKTEENRHTLVCFPWIAASPLLVWVLLPRTFMCSCLMCCVCLTLSANSAPSGSSDVTCLVGTSACSLRKKPNSIVKGTLR